MRNMSRETFDRVYNKLKPFLSMESSGLRWNPKGKERPSEEQFRLSYGLKVK